MKHNGYLMLGIISVFLTQDSDVSIPVSFATNVL